jgi:hypothetical protein
LTKLTAQKIKINNVFASFLGKLSSSAKLLFLAYITLSFSACFKMGIPEYFLGGFAASPKQLALLQESNATNQALSRYLGKSEINKQRILLLGHSPNETVSLKTALEDGPTSLGYQFVLGLFPISRLYLQHGTQSLLEELLLSSLLEQDFAPYTTSNISTSKLELIKPTSIIKPEITNVKVNAYDAIFFRILVIKGDILIQHYYKSRGQLYQHDFKKKFYSSTFSKSGHAPYLALELEKEIRRTLNKIVDQISKQSPRSASVITTDDIRANLPVTTSDTARPILLVGTPEVRVEPSPELRQLFSDSYGFRGLRPLSMQAVTRIMQRGALLGLADLEDHVVAYQGETVNIARPNNSIWYYRTELIDLIPTNKLDVNEGLELRFRASLSELNSSRVFQLMSEKCKIRVLPHAKVDGYWVAGLEESISTVTKSLFADKTTGSKDLENNILCLPTSSPDEI